VRRQQERDVSVLLPTIQHLAERQYQLFFLFQTVIARHKPEGFARLVDDDVAEAAASMAATLETASRGVIYEHGTQSPVAQRLATEMKALVAELREQGAKVYDGETAIVLRAIEQGARETRTKVEGDAIAYLSLMARLVHHNTTQPSEPAAATARGSSLILP
jgi:hypothetical protein